MIARHDKAEVSAAARGHWRNILIHLAGFHADHLDGKGHPCPHCGGHDRFNAGHEFADTGTAFCRQCGLGGDGFSVLMKVNGWAFPEAVETVGEYLNGGYLPPVPTRSAPAARKQVRYENHTDLSEQLHRRAVSAGHIERLSTQIGVSAEALLHLRCGWDGESWVFPERDASGQVIGISRRLQDGRKLWLTGNRGLTLGLNGQSMHIYCVEGATDSAAAIDDGLRVIGRPSNAGGATLLIEYLKRHPGQLICIVGENDIKPDRTWPGLIGAASVAQKIQRAIPAQEVRVALPGDRCKDVREWKATYPDGDLLESLETFEVSEAVAMAAYVKDYQRV